MLRPPPKPWELRSRLYRRRFLQVKTRWKALDEIYKIYIYASLGEKNRIENEIMKMYTHKKLYILLHRSDLNISAKNRQHFLANEYWISFFFIFCDALYMLFCDFLWNFVRISRQFSEKSDVCRFFTQICENELESCRKFKILKFVKIIQYCSILFSRVLTGDPGGRAARASAVSRRLSSAAADADSYAAPLLAGREKSEY